MDDQAKRAALYLRVSTVDKQQTTETQRRDLETYCQRRGWEIVEIYEDHESGRKGARRP